MLETRKRMDPELAKKQEELLKKRKEEQNKLSQIMTATFNSPNGQHALKWIAKKCGAFESSLMISKDGKNSSDLSIVKESYRLFYLELTELIEHNLVSKVESDLRFDLAKGLE